MEIEIPEESMPNPYEELLEVKKALQIAKKYGLEAEVVFFALEYMQSNPKLSVRQVLDYALLEWDM
jgi:hypothetical protein